jgi:hypothetical protein
MSDDGISPAQSSVAGSSPREETEREHPCPQHSTAMGRVDPQRSQDDSGPVPPNECVLVTVPLGKREEPMIQRVNRLKGSQ